MATLSQTPIPSPSSRGHMKPRVLVASFGGGYEQRTGDGPTNTNLRDWALVWENISRSQVDTLNAFFEARAGVEKFGWVQLIPFAIEGEKNFICEEWDWVYLGGDTHRFTAMLLQRPL